MPTQLAATVWEAPHNGITPAERHDRLAKLGDLIETIPICMVTTTGPDGSIHSRPMAYLHMEPDGELVFFTRAASTKVNEIRRNNYVNVSFSDFGRNCYISVSGLARISNDRNKMVELFTAIMKTWFPGGVEDPTLRLFIVQPYAAEYWDGPSGLKFVYTLAKSLLTGAPLDPGQHEFLEL